MRMFKLVGLRVLPLAGWIRNVKMVHPIICMLILFLLINDVPLYSITFPEIPLSIISHYIPGKPSIRWLM